MKLQGLGFVIWRFATDTITITRPGASSYDADGTAIFAAASTSTTRAHVERPARQGDLRHLPEGDRVSRTCSVWANVELRHRDVITLEDGERYELQAVEPWPEMAGFWQAVGLKVQQ